MSAFSATTIEALTAAGWQAGRYVDPDPFIAEVESQGCVAFPKVIEFLSEYGGLHIPVRRLPGFSKPGFLVIDPIAIHGMFEHHAYFREIQGREVAPIGKGYYIFWMTDEGDVFLSFDEEFVHVGNSGEDAIEGIVTGRPRPPRYSPYIPPYIP